jgi:hypothetical protein
MKEILEAQLPGTMATISSDIPPEIFEPERNEHDRRERRARPG